MRKRQFVFGRLRKILAEQNLPKKDIMTFGEACMYVGLSKSAMYKKTSTNQIPFFKPNGKIIYFKKEDLDHWMLTNRQSSVNEIEGKVSNFLIQTKRR